MKLSARTARRIVRNRRNEAKAALRPHTLRGHVLRAGVPEEFSTGVANGLRPKAKAAGVTGTEVRMFRTDEAGNKLWRSPVKGARRYTMGEVSQILKTYKPRKAEYKAAREALAAYSG